MKCIRRWVQRRRGDQLTRERDSVVVRIREQFVYERFLLVFTLCEFAHFPFVLAPEFHLENNAGRAAQF